MRDWAPYLCRSISGHGPAECHNIIYPLNYLIMISIKMQEAINAQINAEMWSAYLYLAMSMDAEDKLLKGMAHWFHKQYEEEMEHAFKFVGYLQDQQAKVILYPIAEVPATWDSALAMYEQTLEHEKKVTRLIHALCSLAFAEKDYATLSLLEWYVDEQVEEENTASDIVEILRRVGNEQHFLYEYDRRLGKR